MITDACDKACLVSGAQLLMAHESANTAMSEPLIAAVRKAMGIDCSRGHRMPSTL